MTLGLLAGLRLRSSEGHIVHSCRMTRPVPHDGSMLVTIHGLRLVDLELLEQVKERLVAAIGKRSQLIVIPLLLQDGLRVDFLVASERDLMDVSARLTHEDSDPDESMRRLVLFTIDTISIERHLQLLIEIVLQGLWLRLLARGDEVRLGFLRLLFLNNFLGLGRSD